jgi:DNA-binding CsgD family transcriptional regulator
MGHAIFVEPTSSEGWHMAARMKPRHLCPLRQTPAAQKKNQRRRKVYPTASRCSEDVHSATRRASRQGEHFVATRSRSHALRAAREITARQREVLGLIALGLTNKEMAHSLGISERGAAAHVSRLLAHFSVPNRAGLIARTFSNAVASRTSGAVSDKSDTVPLPPEIVLELEAYRRSTFQIGLTVGPENVLVYVNEAGKKLFGIDPETASGARYATRRASPGTNAFREGSARVLKTGKATTIEQQQARWLRDDGTWSSGRFSCVLQPLREATGRVFGLLWICTPGLEAS